MKDILSTMQASMQALRDKGNAALKGLGPLDMIEAGQEIVQALRCLNWSYDEMKDILEKMDQVNAKLDSYTQKAGEDAVAAALQAGDVVKKVDHENALLKTETTVRAQVEGEFQGKIAAQQAVNTRRGELVTKFGAHVAAAVPEAVLAADPDKTEGFAALVKELDRRVTAGNAIAALKSKPEMLASVACGAAFDEAGATEFDSRMGVLCAVGGKPAAGDHGQVRGALKGGTLVAPEQEQQEAPVHRFAL